MVQDSMTKADNSKERRTIGIPQNQFIRDTSEACAEHAQHLGAACSMG